MLVNPGVPIPEEASAVHGIHDTDVTGMPDFGVVGPRFIRHLDGTASDSGLPPVLCGFNAVAFDVPLINAEFARHGIAYSIDPKRVVDPSIWVKRPMCAMKIMHEACFGLACRCDVCCPPLR